jgi:redox-sensitive bicupin YhaK (pirin superfamily)
MRAGRGVWHGKEMSAGEVPRLQGFQLWLALPPVIHSSCLHTQMEYFVRP